MARIHQKKCIELRDVALKYVDMLVGATEGISEEEIGPALAYSLAELDE